MVERSVAPWSKSSRKICAFGAIVMLAYAGLLCWKSIAGFPTVMATHRHWPWLGNKPFGEDGFYLLTVANYLGTTHHLLYNYGRTATGIQPLITFLFAGVAWLVQACSGDRWTLVRVLLLFNTSLFVLFSWQLASIAESFAPLKRGGLVFVFAFYLTLCDFSLFRLFNYGLETGIYLLLISCAYRITLCINRRGEATWREVIGLGIIGGLAGLARIDFGVLLAIVFVFLLVRRGMTILQVAVCGILALIVVSPWFIFVHRTIGSWMPSSGQMEGGLISAQHLDRISAMAVSLLPNLAPWAFRFTAPYSLATWFGVVSVGFLIYLFYRSPETRRWLVGSGGYLSQSAPWLAAIPALIGIYMLGFSVVEFYTRYTTPLLILSVPIAALVLAEQTVFRSRPVIVLAFLAVIFSAFDLLSLHTGNMGSNWILTAGYVQRYYPDAHVAAFQSGTIGYFDSNVDNLDGKLNIDALRARRENRMAQYIDAQGYKVLVDWSGYFDAFPPEYLKRNWMPCPQAMYASGSICLIRKPAM